MVVNDREPAVFCLAGGGWVGGPPPSCITGTSLLFHNVLAYRNTHTISSFRFKDHHLPSYLNLQMYTCPFQLNIFHLPSSIFHLPLAYDVRKLLDLRDQVSSKTCITIHIGSAKCLFHLWLYPTNTSLVAIHVLGLSDGYTKCTAPSCDISGYSERMNLIYEGTILQEIIWKIFNTRWAYYTSYASRDIIISMLQPCWVHRAHER